MVRAMAVDALENDGFEALNGFDLPPRSEGPTRTSMS